MTKLRAHDIQGPPIALPQIWQHGLSSLSRIFDIPTKTICQGGIKLAVEILRTISEGNRVEITVRNQKKRLVGHVPIPKELRSSKFKIR